MKKSYSFRKLERLNGQKEIEQLFQEGESTFLYPFKVYFKHTQKAQDSFPKILISVPKRHFKNATERNLIKRRIRESYRQSDFKQKEKNYNIAFVYIAKEIVNYQLLSRKLNSLLGRLK